MYQADTHLYYKYDNGRNDVVSMWIGRKKGEK